MLLCRPTADYHGRRDLAFVPVTGLPDSVLGLVHHTARETARVRAFRTAVTEATEAVGTAARAADAAACDVDLK